MFNKYHSKTNFEQYKQNNITDIFFGENIVMYKSKCFPFWCTDTWRKKKLYPKITSNIRHSRYTWKFYIHEFKCNHKSMIHNIMKNFCYKEYIINGKAYYLDYNDPINLKHLILRYNEE